MVTKLPVRELPVLVQDMGKKVAGLRFLMVLEMTLAQK
jgi:hypothetical protein